MEEWFTTAPCASRTPKVGDIVLARVYGNGYLYLVKAVDGERFQIGNNRGGISGWVGPHGIYKVIKK